MEVGCGDLDLETNLIKLISIKHTHKIVLIQNSSDQLMSFESKKK